jgi:hypothetical protein
MAADPLLGEVVDRPEREEVLQHAEAPLDALQREVVADDRLDRCLDWPK